MSYPITYWYGIRQEYLCRERIVEAAEAGFNVIECRYDRETNFQVLEWCRELGIKAFVFDDRMYGAINGSEGWENNLISMINDYKDYPALDMWFVRDEPTEPLFDALGRVSEFMRKNDPAHGVYINLLPLCAVLPLDNYKNHVNGFLDAVKPPLLSYDHYNLMKREVTEITQFPEAPVSDECRKRNGWENKIFEAWDREGFYDNLELIRNIAAERNIPWMDIILLVEHWHYRKLTEGEIRWEAFTSFAYGSAMLSYFTYWTPGVSHTEPWSYHHGIIESDGTRDANYEIVKKLNRDIQNIYAEVENSPVTAVYHIGKEPTEELIKPFEPFGWIKDISADALIVSNFENGCVMLVNKLHHASQTVTVKTTGGKLRIFNQSAGWTDIKEQDGAYKFTLTPGDGVLVKS